MWQALFDELESQGFVVIAVATDTAEAARPWIEAGKARYPCLIDADHHVAELYGLVNVPQAVWIDENGRIVRPPETAGSNDGFRAMDRKTFTVAPEVLAERARVKNVYFDAVRDWARNGARSRHALTEQAALARIRPADAGVGRAHALFRLGRHLLGQGRDDEAARCFATAIDLHPDSWSLYRQTHPKDARGLATSPQFWARVDALGGRHYYAPIEMEGLGRDP